MSNVFSEIIRNVSRNMPKVELMLREVSTAGPGQQVCDGPMDIGFGWSVPKAPGECIQSLVLPREPLVAAVPVQSVYAGHATITFAELAAERFVTFRQDMVPR